MEISTINELLKYNSDVKEKLTIFYEGVNDFNVSSYDYLQSVHDKGNDVVVVLVNKLLEKMYMSKTDEKNLKSILDIIFLNLIPNDDEDIKEDVNECVQMLIRHAKGKRLLSEDIHKFKFIAEMISHTAWTIIYDSTQEVPIEIKDALIIVDKLFYKTFQQVRIKKPPSSEGWQNLLKKYTVNLFDILGEISSIDCISFFMVYILSKVMTGCFQYKNNKINVLTQSSDSQWSFDENTCRCLKQTDFSETQCKEAYPLIEKEKENLELTPKLCYDAENGSTGDSQCLFEHDVFKHNPICQLSNKKYVGAEPLVCDGRALYYHYELWNWGSLFANTVYGWDNLFSVENVESNSYSAIMIFIMVLIFILIVYVLFLFLSKQKTSRKSKK